MKTIVGIGNPGAKYDGTRHNAGFAVLDALAGTKAWKKNAKLVSLSVEDEGALLLKPQTFVNLSGQAVEGLSYLKVAPQDILVVCDDVNLPLGTLRLRGKGSAGGHHGLESIIAALGSEEFPRLRVGVANERMPKELSGFVLEKFETTERAVFADTVKRAVAACQAWIEKDLNQAQTVLDQTSAKKSGGLKSQE